MGNMSDSLLVPVIYGRLISHAAASSPTEVRKVLEGTGIDDSIRGHQSRGMNLAQYKRLLKNAIEVSGDPAVVLLAGSNLSITTHGALGLAAVTSPTLRASLETFAYFARVRNPYCLVSLVTEGRYAEFCIELDSEFGELADAALDLILGAVTSGPLKLSGADLSLFRLKLTRPMPDNAGIYSKLLPCSISYGEPVNAFVFLDEELNQSLIGSDSEEYARSIDRCRAIYSTLESQDSYRESVINVFLNQSGRICTLATVADVLHVSTRTLNRRLKAESTNFQTVLDEWLGGEAVKYLIQDKFTVEATAALLGYRDEANFRRAFKRWFGSPPSIYLSDHRDIGNQ
jgi:AraC-like DNA-binding protein